MPDPIIAISNLSYSYDDRKAIDDLSLSIDRGEILGFLGPNGSGKTTLFRILSTLIPAPVGTVRVLGFDPAVQTNQVRRALGVVFQSPSLDKQLTAFENLRHHGHLYGLSGDDLENRIQTQLRRVDLLDRAGERVDGFSGGMRRRVELAKGLLNKPQILLLDEPSTGLDPGARIDLWRSLGEIQAAGVTILLTTHLMDEADRCTRLAVLARGKVLACDTPAALKSSVGGDVMTITTNHAETLAKVLLEKLSLSVERTETTLRVQLAEAHQMVPKVIEAAPGLVESISVGKPTLEDVFIRVTGKRFVDHEPPTTSGSEKPGSAKNRRKAGVA